MTMTNQKISCKNNLSHQYVRNIIHISFLILFFQIIPAAFGQTFSDVLQLEKKGETEKSLKILYQLSDKTTDEDELFNVLDKILSLDNNIIRVINTEERKIPLISDNVKKAILIKKTALLMQLAGMIDRAGDYYESAYNTNPVEGNLPLLLDSAVLNLETGNIEKSIYLADFVIDKTRNKEEKQKGLLIIAYISLIQGDPIKAEKIFAGILDEKSGVKSAPAVYKISLMYNLENLKNKAKDIIIRNYGKKTVDELDIYLYPVSPLVLFENTGNVKTEREYYAFIQTGVYNSEANASNMIKKIGSAGLSGIIREYIKEGTKYYKVLVPAKTESDAENINMILKHNSIESFMIFD